MGILLIWYLADLLTRSVVLGQKKIRVDSSGQYRPVNKLLISHGESLTFGQSKELTGHSETRRKGMTCQN